MGAYDVVADLNLNGAEEVGVFGKLDDDGSGKLGEIARGCNLALPGQTIHIDIMRVGHPESLRRLVHALDERLVTAWDPFCDHDGGVVGRHANNSLERVV